MTLDSAELSAGDIEKAFWICDYVASTRGMREQKPKQHRKLELEESR